MNIFQNLFGRTIREESTNASAAGATGSSGSSASGDWAERVIRPMGRSSLLVPAWCRGVQLIMQTMGQMKVQYQRMSKVGGNFTEDDYGSNGVLNYLLQVRPNPLMTATQMLEQIEYRKIYYGNAYVYIEHDFQGNVSALWLCDTCAYDAVGNTYSPTYRMPGRLVSLSRVPAGDILHFKNVFLYDDMMQGIPTILYAMKALSIQATADELTLSDMAKGGKQKVIIQENTPQAGNFGLTAMGRADQTEMKKLAHRFGEDWMDGDVVFLDNIADAKIISQTAADLRTLENRGYGVADIARILGIPLIMMMVDSSGSGYKTPEAATQEFLLRTIQPRIKEMEDELNSKLLGAYDFGKRRIHVCEQMLRRLDPTAQANLDKIHLETGAMNPNEIRAQYDLGTIPDGDKFYVSTNLAVVGSDKLSAAAGSGGQPNGPAEPANPAEPNGPAKDDDE